MRRNRYVRKMGMNLLSAVCRAQVHKNFTTDRFLKIFKSYLACREAETVGGFGERKYCSRKEKVSNREMEFLDMNLTKDSSLLLHAIHSPFYWRI
jgi:hypothetical protein